MQAIVTKKLAFRNPVTRHGKYHIIDPSPKPQHLPEWVRNTFEFKQATKAPDPCLTEIVVRGARGSKESQKDFDARDREDSVGRSRDSAAGRQRDIARGTGERGTRDVAGSELDIDRRDGGDVSEGRDGDDGQGYGNRDFELDQDRIVDPLSPNARTNPEGVARVGDPNLNPSNFPVVGDPKNPAAARVNPNPANPAVVNKASDVPKGSK